MATPLEYPSTELEALLHASTMSLDKLHEVDSYLTQLGKDGRLDISDMVQCLEDLKFIMRPILSDTSLQGMFAMVVVRLVKHIFALIDRVIFKKYGMILIEVLEMCIDIAKDGFKDVNMLRSIRTIYECIANQESISFNSQFIKSCSRAVLNSLIGDHLKVCYLRQLVKFINTIVDKSHSDELSQAAIGIHHELSRLCKLVRYCGDYALQVSILGLVTRYVPISTKEDNLVVNMFSQFPDAHQVLLTKDFKNFNVDCRTFLNCLNMKNDRFIFTISSTRILYKGEKLYNSQDPNFGSSWVDFNRGTRSLSIVKQTDGVHPENIDYGVQWEPVMITNRMVKGMEVFRSKTKEGQPCLILALIFKKAPALGRGLKKHSVYIEFTDLERFAKLRGSYLPEIFPRGYQELLLKENVTKMGASGSPTASAAENMQPDEQDMASPTFWGEPQVPSLSVETLRQVGTPSLVEEPVSGTLTGAAVEPPREVRLRSHALEWASEDSQKCEELPVTNKSNHQPSMDCDWPEQVPDPVEQPFNRYDSSDVVGKTRKQPLEGRDEPEVMEDFPEQPIQGGDSLDEVGTAGSDASQLGSSKDTSLIPQGSRGRRMARSLRRVNRWEVEYPVTVQVEEEMSGTCYDFPGMEEDSKKSKWGGSRGRETLRGGRGTPTARGSPTHISTQENTLKNGENSLEQVHKQTCNKTRKRIGTQTMDSDDFASLQHADVRPVSDRLPQKCKKRISSQQFTRQDSIFPEESRRDKKQRGTTKYGKFVTAPLVISSEESTRSSPESTRSPPESTMSSIGERKSSYEGSNRKIPLGKRRRKRTEPGTNDAQTSSNTGMQNYIENVRRTTERSESRAEKRLNRMARQLQLLENYSELLSSYQCKRKQIRGYLEKTFRKSGQIGVLKSSRMEILQKLSSSEPDDESDSP